MLIPTRSRDTQELYATRVHHTQTSHTTVAPTRCSFRPPNGSLNQLQAAPHASGDAARPLPRLKMYSAGVTCNGRDAVANNSAEALQRRAKVSAA